MFDFLHSKELLTDDNSVLKTYLVIRPIKFPCCLLDEGLFRNRLSGGHKVMIPPLRSEGAHIKAPMVGDNDYQAAESGLRQRASLTDTPTATGNVIFFVKFQVLFANGAAFAGSHYARMFIQCKSNFGFER